jgi:hypothetical protein
MPGKKRLTREFVAAEFKKLGYKLITKTYVNSKQLLEVRCKKGHKWVVCWNNFVRGHRCGKCFKQSKVKGSKTLKKIILRDKYYSVSEAARTLGVKDSDLRRHIELGLLPGPTRSFGTTKKYYKLADIKKIEAMIE